MRRMTIRSRIAPLNPRRCLRRLLRGIRRNFFRLSPLLRVGFIRVTHPCAGRRRKYCYLPAAPRLACVKPVASVHPEPGSNSSLFLYLLFFSFLFYNRAERDLQRICSVCLAFATEIPAAGNSARPVSTVSSVTPDILVFISLDV